jgi:hypothetical protein
LTFADRVQPIGALHSKGLVDRDKRPGLEPDGLQTEVACRGSAPDRHQQLVGDEIVPGLERHRDGPVAEYLSRRHTDADVDAAFEQCVMHLLRRERLLTREQPRQRLDDRHLRTERRPRLTELHADDAAAEHDQALGHFVRRRALTVRPRRRLGEPGDRRERPAHFPPRARPRVSLRGACRRPRRRARR